MNLASLHSSDRSARSLVIGVLSLFEAWGGPLSEEVKPLWWPEKWADDALRDPRLLGWLKSMGIKGQFGKPMQGRVGRAYPIGDSHILKLTTDQKEARAAATLKGHDSKHAADIYGVHRVSSHDHNGRRVTLYAIAMQRLNTGVGGRMRAAGNAVYSYLDDNYGFIKDPQAVFDVVMNKYVDKRMRSDSSMKFAVRKVIQALYDVQQKTGVLSQDPHGGNMAFKGREPAFFDFGRSTQDFDHPKAQDARITSLPEEPPETQQGGQRRTSQ